MNNYYWSHEQLLLEAYGKIVGVRNNWWRMEKLVV